MKPEVAVSILDNVYAAGASPVLWPVALEQLGQVFHCSCVSLVDKDLKTSAATAFAWGIDAAGERSYLDYWLPRNIFHLRTRVWRPGEVQTDRTILPKHELLRSEYYNGFLKPFEMHAMMRVALSVDDRSVHLLSLARSARAGEYEETDLETFRPLVRHLQRAASITRHMNDAQGALSGFSDLLEQSATGILLLSMAGRVIFVNRAARAMLDRNPVLELRASRLAARDPRDSAILQRLIAGATGALHDLADARGGAFRLGAADRRLTVVVGPLAGRIASGPNSPAAFVLLTDPDRGLSRPARMLRNLYGLTAAEIAMAKRLMNGDTPQQAAAALGIKVSTARFHLGALFRKTDTRRQAELVRLLLSLPDT